MNPGIETVVDYLSSVPAWYLATCEGDQPHVRPFSFVAGFDGRIWFCTGRQKDVFRELEENPRLEVSAWKPGSGWLVLRGEADFTDVVNDLIRRAGFAHMRSLGEAYEGIEDENLAFFSVRSPRAWIRDIDGSETELDFVDVPPAWMVNEKGEIVETPAEQTILPDEDTFTETILPDEGTFVDATLSVEEPYIGAVAPVEEPFPEMIPPDESTFVEAIPPDESTLVEDIPVLGSETAPGPETVIDETLVIEQPHNGFMQAPQAFYPEPAPAPTEEAPKKRAKRSGRGLSSLF